jgi:DNA-binding LacI/PurR family transcriptional regulator
MQYKRLTSRVACDKLSRMSRVTIKELARAVEVDPSTVSLAFNHKNRVAAGTRDRIFEAAKKLGYRPNQMARGLRRGDVKTIAILAPKLLDSYVVDMIAAQEQWLKAQGFTAMLSITHGDEKMEQEVIDQMASHGVRGCIFDYQPRSYETFRQLDELIQRNGWCVAMAGSAPLTSMHSLDVDWNRISEQVVDHLYGFGHRQIALVCHDHDDPRIMGVRQAMARRGAAPADSVALIVSEYLHQDVAGISDRIMAMDPRPTAVLAYNDDLAIALMAKLDSYGLRIPQDISIVGVNDSWHSAMGRVPLTTVRIDVAGLGKALAENVVVGLSEKGSQASRGMIPGELIIRKSTGAISC